MTVSLIVIADQEFGIGSNNQTLWKFPAYEQYFKQLTSGQSVVMGRKTFDSRGPISGAVNMIVSKNPIDVSEPGVFCDTNLHDAIERCKWKSEQVYIVGGAELFESALINGVVDKLYLTHIAHKTYNCDVFFQDSYIKDWFNESHRTVRYADKENRERLEFIVYTKRKVYQAKDKKKTQ